MLHRIFLAINLSESLKEEMLSVKTRLPEVPCKWTRKENLHFTLVFLGNVSDKELEAVFAVAKKVGERHEKFSITLSHIQYGPDQNHPRMIWAVGNASKELLVLQKNLEKALIASPALNFTPEKRPYSLHLTLGRLHGIELQTMEQSELPVIEEEISWNIPVESFEIMESKLNTREPEYTLCGSISLE